MIYISIGQLCFVVLALFRRSAILKVYGADTCYSANVWIKVRFRVRIRVSGNSIFSE